MWKVKEALKHFYYYFLLFNEQVRILLDVH